MTCHLDVSNRPDKVSRIVRENVAEDLSNDDTWKGEHIISGLQPDLNATRSHAWKSRKGVEFKRTKEKDQ